MLKDMNKFEKPRERLAKYGAESLNDIELIAILLRTGIKSKSVIDLAREVLKEFDDLNSLNHVTIEELSLIKGISETKAVTILAAIELGKRISLKYSKKQKITKPIDVYKILRPRMENLDHEELFCVYLNVKSEIMKIKQVTIGTSSSTLFETKDILKWALKYSSSHVIIAHNHPSGDPTPSENDKIITKKLINSGKELDIKIIDHIVVGKNDYYSFLEKAYIFN